MMLISTQTILFNILQTQILLTYLRYLFLEESEILIINPK